jgi:preprotein translocase subunit SecD
MKNIILSTLFLYSVSVLAAKLEIKHGNRTIITSKDISSVLPIESATGKWDISIQLKPKVTKKFANKTKKLQGQKLDITLDSELISSPRIQTTIDTGSVQLGAQYTKEQAIEMAKKINEQLKVKK